MRVLEVMHTPAAVCTPDMSLAAAAAELCKNGCGCLPVVGEGGNVIGMITDRDIGMALARSGDEPSKVPVWEAMRHKLFTCSREDDIHCALKTFRAQKIRRLPVVNRTGVIEGVLCLDDIVLKAQPDGGRSAISFEDVVKTYQSICTRDDPGLNRRAPAAKRAAG